MPRIKTGTSLPMWAVNTSRHMGSSASESQNSQASSATESSGSCVLNSMYCNSSHTRTRTRTHMASQQVTKTQPWKWTSLIFKKRQNTTACINLTNCQTLNILVKATAKWLVFKQLIQGVAKTAFPFSPPAGILWWNWHQRECTTIVDYNS